MGKSTHNSHLCCQCGKEYTPKTTDYNVFVVYELIDLKTLKIDDRSIKSAINFCSKKCGKLYIMNRVL